MLLVYSRREVSTMFHLLLAHLFVVSASINKGMLITRAFPVFFVSGMDALGSVYSMREVSTGSSMRLQFVYVVL